MFSFFKKSNRPEATATQTFHQFQELSSELKQEIISFAGMDTLGNFASTSRDSYALGQQTYLLHTTLTKETGIVLNRPENAKDMIQAIGYRKKYHEYLAKDESKAATYQAKALHLFHKVINKGETSAYLFLAMMYQDKNCRTVELTKAVDTMSAAYSYTIEHIDKISPKLCFELATFMLNFSSDAGAKMQQQLDNRNDFALLSKAALTVIKNIHEIRNFVKKGISLLEQLHERGYLKATSTLLRIYENGFKSIRPDPKKVESLKISLEAPELLNSPKPK